ncbi:uncharacterized protein [Euphorbia lathyris]|uniref:uncharacterized protein isoform X2 n=1 Tax=Euphorbia lathyris TaxID=212925 RepID=UPI0033138185
MFKGSILRRFTDCSFDSSDCSWPQLFMAQCYKAIILKEVCKNVALTKNIVNFVNQMENTKKPLPVDFGTINEMLKLATQNLHYVNLLPSIAECL